MHLESFPDCTSAPLTLKQQLKLEARRNTKWIQSGLFSGVRTVCVHAWKATGELHQPSTIPRATAGDLGANKLQTLLGCWEKQRLEICMLYYLCMAGKSPVAQLCSQEGYLLFAFSSPLSQLENTTCLLNKTGQLAPYAISSCRVLLHEVCFPFLV